MAEGEVVGWHHVLNGHEFEQIPGVGDVQGSLEHCSPWCHKESDMTEHRTASQLKMDQVAYILENIRQDE